jgi:peptidoglycan biosynthesis protein MviN/MurJ (putative lipid II flippase)
VLAVKLLPSEDEQVAGLALAISMAVLLEAANLSIALRRAVPEFALGPLGWSLVRVNLAAGVMLAGLGWIVQHVTHAGSLGFFGSLATVALCVPLGACLYLAVALLLRVPEAKTVLAGVLRRLGL